MPRVSTASLPYRPLAKTFRSKSFDYRLVRRVLDFAIYEQSQSGVVVGFELIVVGQQDAGEMKMGGTKIKLEAKETYPPISQWGRSGFTFRTERSALDALTAFLVYRNYLVASVIKQGRRKFVELTYRMADALWHYTADVRIGKLKGARFIPLTEAPHKSVDVYFCERVEVESMGFKIVGDFDAV